MMRVSKQVLAGGAVLAAIVVGGLALGGEKPSPAYIPSPEARAGGCDLPTPAADAQVVLYGTYEGTEPFRGRFGRPHPDSTVATVEIQPGTRPLYLILSSYDPVVWTFEGAVERVAQVVLMTPGGGGEEGAPAGVIGVPAAKLAAASDDACFRHVDKPAEIDAVRARAAVREVLGREPDVVAASYGTERVILPSGWYVRTGAVSDPSAPRSAVSYALPEAIEPLIAAGAVQVLDYSEIKIVKPIEQWPAGHEDDRVRRVLLGTGVSVPPGLPKGACVFTEAGELLNPGFGCRSR